MLKRLGRNELGQDLAEYAIALAVITVGVIVAVQVVGTRVRTVWQNVATTLQQAT
jgi:Flp pilus assembly pilin Flp